MLLLSPPPLPQAGELSTKEKPSFLKSCTAKSSCRRTPKGQKRRGPPKPSMTMLSRTVLGGACSLKTKQAEEKHKVPGSGDGPSMAISYAPDPYNRVQITMRSFVDFPHFRNSNLDQLPCVHSYFHGRLADLGFCSRAFVVSWSI